MSTSIDISTKEKAARVAALANDRLAEIQNAERYARNKALLGKAFKYRNSYSCPEKRGNYWWLYAKVVKVDQDGHLMVFMFQTDKYGNVDIKPSEHRYHMDDYTGISASEFHKAWGRLRLLIASMARHDPP